MDAEENIVEQKTMEDWLNSRKEIVTTTIPSEVKKYADDHNIYVNRLIEIGFRTLFVTRGENKRITELEDSVSRLQKAIDFYDRRLRDIQAKFNSIKEKHKLEEDL